MMNNDDIIFTISIPSNFTSPSFDCRRFIHGSNLKMYVKDFPGVHYNAADEGYKCTICEIFLPLGITKGHSSDKFASEAVKTIQNVI